MTDELTFYCPPCASWVARNALSMIDAMADHATRCLIQYDADLDMQLLSAHMERLADLYAQ